VNDIKTWQQGKFIDGPEYRNAGEASKEFWEKAESVLVRPTPTGNAICVADTPEHAVWIANRLNLASMLEEMVYDYATGKSDGNDIVAFVKEASDG
jgi:hypothetical protein